MAVQSPDSGPGINPDDVARTTFTAARKGYDPIEVQSFLVSVAAELRQARTQILELEQGLRAAQAEADRNREVDPSRLTAMLGEETARVLDAARGVADDMRAKAEESTARLLREATADAARMRQEATEVLARATRQAESELEAGRRDLEALKAQAVEDAASEVEAGRQQGREMVAEAQNVRERMLNDLARRRKAFRQQIERLQAGRDRLLAAYDVVRETLDVATDELQVALPEARLAAESASLRVGDEDMPTLEELEQEAATLPASAAVDEPETETPTDVEDEVADAVVGGIGDPTPEADVDADEPDAPAADAGGEPDELVEEPGEAEPEPAVASRPRVPAAPEIEGRRSSSVNVIRAEPDLVAEAEPDVAADGDEAETVPDEAESEAPTGEVSSLFARIRSETEGESEAEPEPDIVLVEETIVVEEVDGEIVAAAVIDEIVVIEPAAEAAEPEAEPEPELSPGAAVIAQRDAALVEVERNLSRRIKRELSDEQNELLDTVRRQKGTPTAAKAMPALEVHLKRYTDAALPSLVAAAAAGVDLVAGLEGAASSSGAPKTRAGDLASELAADLVEGLRDRVERAFSEAAGDDDELAERLRACYREWKGQRVDELASRFALAACNRGLLDGLAEGTLVHWVVDDGDTPSPDCDDNALADGVRKGDKFPTGHVVPPISATCRCIVLPAQIS